MSKQLGLIGGLPHGTFDLLELLALHPEGMTITGIAMRFGIKDQSAYRRVFRARTHGLVTITPADGDVPAYARLSSLGGLRLRQAFDYLDRRSTAA